MVDDSFRMVMAGAAAVVLLMALLAIWILAFSRPQVARYEQGLVALQASHNAMLNQETGVRAFITTGNATYLEPYDLGRRQVDENRPALLSLAEDPSLTVQVVDLAIAQRQWMDSWAVPAIAAAKARPLVPGTPQLNTELAAGKKLFDAYRVDRLTMSNDVTGLLDGMRTRQSQALIGVTLAGVLIGLLMFAGAVQRRRVLRRDLLTPIDSLRDGLEAVREGRYEEPIDTTGPHELLQIVAGFNAMTAALGDGRRLAVQREQHINDQAQQLRGILKMVREIGGSLNLKYVVKSIVEGVHSVTHATRVSIWLVNEHEASLYLAHDSEPDATTDGSIVELGTGVVGRAAKYGRSNWGNAQDGEGRDHLAVPLIIGARVVGVLELTIATGRSGVSDEQIDVLETLSIHAGAAIEAARLHQTTSHASEHDALTRLANRRRLEADLTLECDRSLRYARPVALIMLDLDHFKQVNDTYGHARGDEILQGVAETINATLRSTDTAYRFGGEELVVLARETDDAGAFTLAERIRSSIERRFAGQGESGVTSSLGVASVPEHAASPKALIAAADAALYASKRAGRNQTTIASATAQGDAADESATEIAPVTPLAAGQA